ncbi:MAG: hypothetical protein ACK5LL_11640 [Suipraeoptans sp.]
MNSGKFPIQDIYNLPEQEVMAKAISVMFYFGFIDLVAFRQRFGKEFTGIFKDEIEYLKAKDLIMIENDLFYITEKGVANLNGVIPMFYSDRSKTELMNMDIEKLLR